MRIAREVIHDSIRSHLPNVNIDDDAVLTREMARRLRERNMVYEIEDSDDGEVILFGNLRFVSIEDLSEYFIKLILQQPVWEQANLPAIQF
jgi:3-phosphoglycerate kinase